MKKGSSHRGTAETNPTRNHGVAGSIPRIAQCVKDPVLLWLWCRSAAVALIQPIAWELPCAVGVNLTRKKITIMSFVHRWKLSKVTCLMLNVALNKKKCFKCASQANYTI